MWENTTSKGHKRRLSFIVVISVAMLVVLSSAAWFAAHRSQSPFPKALKERTRLTLFYPTALPKGYNIDTSSINLKSGVISYVAKNSKDNYINFSLQPRTDKFDFNTFYSTTLLKSFHFTTPYGEAVVGTMSSSGYTVGSLINGDTWLIISASGTVSTEALQSLLSNLKVYDS